VEETINQAQINVQEKAIFMASQPDIVEVESVVSEAPRPRRQSWEWKITDIQLLAKKMPHLVKIMPEEDKINELLKSKKTDGSLDGKEEENYFGITFFIQKLY